MAIQPQVAQGSQESPRSTPGSRIAAIPTSIDAGPSEHPVEAMVTSLEASLSVVSREAWSGLEAPEVRSLYARMSRVAEQLSAHRMAAARVLDAAGTAKEQGAASTGSLLGGDFGGDRREGDDLVRLGDTLEKAGASATEESFAQGKITMAQARVIARILGNLPRDVSQRDQEAAESALLAEAPLVSLRDLRARGDRITEVFRTPAGADQDEEDLVRRREREAKAVTDFWMRDTGAGTYQGGFTIPTLQGEMLKALLDAVASPRREHLRRRGGAAKAQADRAVAGLGVADRAGADLGVADRAGADLGVADRAGADLAGDERSYPQKLGQAFCALIEHTPTDGYPGAGGSAAVVAVSVSLEKLVSETGCGTTSTGVRLTAGEIRRLACTQQILPQVFNGTSLPLDHGALRRLFSRHQRIAIAQRDMGCAMPGCDRPPGWCELHHAGDPWSQGGPTNLDQGVMLCAFHHHLVHDQGWQIRFHPRDGIPEFGKPGRPGWTRNTRYRPPRDLGVAPATA